MPKSAPDVLLVEDDERIRCELLEALRKDGYEVSVSVSLAGARAMLDKNYDLVLLDLGLPDGDGLDLCQDLRDAGRGVPVIILTARDGADERVRGLDLGADDYVVKPFHVSELLARVRAVLRRSGQSVGEGRVQCGDLWADSALHAAGRGELEVKLKPREFDLLAFFLAHPGRTWTRDQLLDRVWGSDFSGDARTVDLHVRRLRAAVEDDPGDPHFIQTVWGVGYRMQEAP